MAGQPPVRAVIFDWGGTLTPWHQVDLLAQWDGFAAALHTDPVGDRAEAGTDLAGGAGQRVRELTAAILAAEQAAWRDGRDTHRSARVEEILVQAGVDPQAPGYPAARSAYEQFWEPHTHTDTQVRPLWERLRADGLRIGVLSNTIWTRDYHRSIFDRDGVLGLVDADVYSSEIPWTKPHPDAFRAAAEAVGVPVEQCVYVGDRLFEDVHGPQQVGMRAIHVPHSDIPAEQRVEVSARPDAVVQTLAEISGVVLGWNRLAG